MLQSCEQESRFGLRARTPAIAPAEATLLDQRVGEPGRPCLPWKQEIGGSNPPTLTNDFKHLRNINQTNAISCAHTMHTLS